MTTAKETPKPAQEHPLANILINVLIPVLALSYLSKDPAIQEMLGKDVRPWHIGPLKALIVALAFPIGYGIWFFAKTKKMNFFSGLGLFSVLLTGGLTLFLWNKDGTVKEHAAVLFGSKRSLHSLCPRDRDHCLALVEDSVAADLSLQRFSVRRE